MSEIQQYPQHQAVRGGGKVSWLYYADREDAEKAAAAARVNAEILAQRGYDFGFQEPGAIDQIGDVPDPSWEKYVGLYEVCIP
jgi:hypothetical protein